MDAGEYETVVFTGLDNVAILGKKGTKLISYFGWDTVAIFRNCTNVTLKNLTIGHELPAYQSCTEGVLVLENAKIKLENCDIFGCGLFGIYAQAADITAIDTTIRDCSRSIMTLDSTNATFQNCIFSGNGYDIPDEWAIWTFANNYWYEQGLVSSDAFSITFSECQFTGNQNPTFYQNMDPGKVSVSVEDCTFSGNTWE